MLGLHVSELSDYSRSVARLIAKKRPSWLEFAREVDVESSPHKALEIRIPNEASLGPISVLTERDELTVCVSEYFHTHFGGHSATECEDDFQQALDFIEGVISEKNVIYWVLRDKKWVQSGIIDRIEFSLLNDVPQGGHRIFTRSWSGNCDQERAIDFDVFKKLW